MKQRFGKGPETQEKNEAKREENPLIPKDMAHYILSFLSVPERAKLREVSKTLKEDVESDVFWKAAGARSYDEFVSRFSQLKYSDEWYDDFSFNNLIKQLRSRVYSSEYKLELAERIYAFWKMTDQSFREMNIDYEQRQSFYEDDFPLALKKVILSREGIMHVLDGTIEINKIKAINWAVLEFFLKNTNANQALRDDLIVLKEVNALSLNNLRAIFFFHDIIENLKCSWFVMSDLAESSNEVINLLFAGYGENYLRQMLNEGLLNFKRINNIPIENLRLINCERGLRLLKNKLSYWNLRKITEEDLRLLLSDTGEQVLLEERFTISDIFKMQPGMLSYLFSDIGMAMTNPSTPLLTRKQLRAIPSIKHARLLFSDVGFTALSEGVIDFTTAIRMTWQRLEIILSEEGINTLKLGHLDVKELILIRNREALRYIISGAGETLFRYGFVDLKDFIHSSETHLKNYLDSYEVAVKCLYDYVEKLCSLNLRLPSLNTNTSRKEKGKELKQLFFEGNSNLDDVNLEKILGDEENLLLSNSSKLPFKFFKLKSRIMGYRNPFLDNRLCESKTEAHLVQFYGAWHNLLA